MEDPQGNVSTLSIYHYPTMLDSTGDDTDVLFPIGTILAAREQFYKLPVDGRVPGIRVDSPSDLIVLDPQGAVAKDAHWNTGESVPGTVCGAATPSAWKESGVDHFKNSRWLCAAVAFSKGLKLDPSNHLLLLNRAETYLRLRWFNSAAHDAEAVIAMDLTDISLKRKAVVRAMKARYFSGRYDDVHHLASLLPQDTDVKNLTAKASQRLHEQCTGQFNWFHIFKETQGTSPRPDIAEYKGPVDVRTPPSGGGPRGLFLTKDVKVGELLVCLIYSGVCRLC